MISHTHRHYVGNMKEFTIVLDDEQGNDNEEEKVELTVYEPFDGNSVVGAYIAFHDDAGERVTFLASQIDDLVEALQQLKREL